MNKVFKRIAMLFIGCGLAFSVSMGAWIPKNYEENYQKLKAEVEEYGGVEDCKWSEDGKLISGNLCQYKNVIAFFDEIRATEGRDGNFDDFIKAVKKVREIPRFKNDGGIYTYVKGAYFNEKIFWENVFDEWDKTKRQLRMDGFRSGYWKKLAE